MATEFPSQARVVIIGGGIAGCSLAYNLTKLGWSDVVLIERARLTSGTTWHAAGLVNQLRSSHTLTNLSRHGIELYGVLEAETGQATGFKRNGSLPVARTAERLFELKRLSALARVFGIEAEIISAKEAAQHHPLIDVSIIAGALWIPKDGQINPVDLTTALAKGARAGGARLFEGVRVTGIKADTSVKAVVTDHGSIVCEYVVNCAGIWAREIGALVGVDVPLYACEHMYVTTGSIPAVTSALPVVRDTDGYCYIKEDAGKLLVGCFEPNAKPLPLDKLPAQFEFGELPTDWDQFELPFSQALELVPCLAGAEIRHFMNGPESFTPDNKFILGEAPAIKNFFVSTGYNSQGILYGAGAGRALAEWIVEGEPTMDLAEVDIARFHPFQTNARYLHDRVRESLGLLYAMHWPHRQVESARPVRRTPFHERLADLNACFGETSGWERANWYAPVGVNPHYDYSYGRQNWFPHSAEEHRATREGVAVFDLSSFGKIMIAGRDAELELQRICSANMAVDPGKTVYTTFLNERGGINSDLTVTRLSPTQYYLVTATSSLSRDLTWLQRNFQPGSHVTATDVTSGFATLAVMGPKSRELLSRLTPALLTNDAFPFSTAQHIEIGYGRCLAIRVTFVGELGWELHIPTEFAVAIFDELMKEGAAFNLRPAGYHALDSLRAEKGYRHWGHDITPADTPYEAGLGFTVALEKPVDFIGRRALEQQKTRQPAKRLVHLKLLDPSPLLIGDEPILCDGAIIGRTTSGAYGHTVGCAVGLGYIETHGRSAGEVITQGKLEIDIAGDRHAAELSLKPLYDPAGTRIRS